jgi:uncharacterized membrane protein YgdD (TMEM256/DUF423 family)
MNTKAYQILGALFILIAIILGALGAHLLKSILSTQQLMSFETGVRFQMYMGLGLLILTAMKSSNWTYVPFILITLGTILFSLSIYLLSLQEILSLNLSFLGPITPIGGLLMIIGWIFVIVNVVKKN